MKITFLGTSHGLPERGRNCSCTMIESGENIYFVDVGAPLAEIMVNRNISYDNVKATFITHPHGDHYFGLYMFINIAKWFRPNCRTQIYLPDTVLYDRMYPEIYDRREESNKFINLHCYNEGELYNDGRIKLRAIATEHMKNVNRPSYAFDIELEDKRILFTGDLTGGQEDFPQVAFSEDFDLIVTECAHASPETLEKNMARCKTKRMVINHIYPFWKMNRLGSLNQKFGYEVIIGNDYDEIYL